MKKVKYFIIGAMMTAIAVPSMAQDQNDQIMEQVTAIINSGAADAVKQVQAIEKLNKKNANALVSIGKAYLAAKDYDKAMAYAEKAIKADSKNGAGYVLKGNIYVGQDNGGEAASWFQQAIYFDPTNPDGYRRYAQIMSKTDPNGAVQTLEDLRAKNPSYPVDLIAAEIYSDAGKLDNAISYYNKVDKSQMKDYQISDYATNLFLAQKYDQSLSVAEYGLQKFPRNASLNRLVMFNNVSKKNYEAAIAAGDKLFNSSDNAKLSANDYGYYATALQEAKRYDDAVAAYGKVAAMDGIDANEKNEINKKISDCYKAKGDYASSAKYYSEYMKNVPGLTAGIMGDLAAIYRTQAADENSSADAKAEAIKKADEVYGEMQQKFPSIADFALLQRARLTFMVDPEGTQGLAKPHYESLVEVVTAKSEQGNAELNKLKEAYNYLQIYYFKVANDTPAAKQWAEKLLSIDPENEVAKKISETK